MARREQLGEDERRVERPGGADTDTGALTHLGLLPQQGLYAEGRGVCRVFEDHVVTLLQHLGISGRGEVRRLTVSQPSHFSVWPGLASHWSRPATAQYLALYWLQPRSSN